ncbi:hypothetical protein [Sinirhodobacter huangdaonensis]|uniref:Periplasmic heavy metal sensor n=1 Tax=Paenirhodobacter huangdaonensis TaxID=2501515 RepID=A0A443LS62_9RHOB|nr:hypothetical protein [Sinirhodobacter huangdaonensis]RWR52007.1 hypothetical protein EOW66_09530 [Sinirhodobacter huangdaonensis]
MTLKRDTGRIVLIAVLAVSLLGNALAAGAVLRFRALQTELLGPAAEQALFPRAVRRDLRAALRENAETLRPALHRLAEDRAAVVAAGAARPFDRAALDAAMVAMRAQLDTTLGAVQQVVGDRLEARAKGE